MMSEIANIKIKLNKSDEGSFGFSLLGKFSGIPHVIYDVIEDSPAAECRVEAGDVILKVNGTDVHRYSTKEVLKCLRLASDPVTLELKRDPTIKDHVRRYLTSNSSNQDLSYLSNNSSPKSPIINTNNGGSRGHRISSSDSLAACRKSRIPVNQTRVPSSSAPQSPQSNNPRYHSHIPVANGCVAAVQQKKPTPRFEAYMMTGDLILNLSRTSQSSSLLPAQTKKVDSLRDSPVRNLKRKNGTAPKAIYDSSPSDSSSDIALHQENNVESNNNNRNNKLSRIAGTIENNNGRLNSITSSVDEEEEQLIMDSSSNEHSECDDRKKNFNMLQKQNSSGCVKNSSSSSSTSSSSNSSPTNTNTNSNSSNNIDDGGGGIDGGGSDEDNVSSKKYSVLENEDHNNAAQIEAHKNNRNIQQQSKDGHLVVTHSASMSSTTTTSSASTTINRSETLLTTPTPDVSHSVPTSPTSLSTPLLEVTAKRRDLANSVPTSPECNQQESAARRCSTNSQQQPVNYARKTDASGFRTSRSEDHLQLSQREGTLGNAIPIDIDEDVTSSLNTLLDTRHDSEESHSSDHERIVWTYNAPIPPTSNPNQVIVSPTSRSSSISTSPQHTDNSPASPTSVSSSVMSSSGSKGKDLSLLNSNATGGGVPGSNPMTMSGEQSVSEAISNISSPDYHDENDLLSARDLSAAMAISDPSDSDSTLIVDEKEKNVIPIADNDATLKNSEDELATLTEEPFNMAANLTQRDASPPISDDGSDVDSLHSFHYSPKAVDMPSAIRLAKRLFTLDGFKKSDVSRHLSKNNEFSRAVADEYLKYFQFETLTLDEALRIFLKQFALSGETQERERVLVHFSKRFLESNPNMLNSQDAVHTLTCAIMLLNTDLHGQNISRKMTCSEFIDNLSELNDGENFPKDLLKQLYAAIKGSPLEWAVDEESNDANQNRNRTENSLPGPPVGPNPFLEISQNIPTVEYKKGYVMRKCCIDSNNKKTPFGKRSWKMFYCTLRDPLVMYLHKDERGFHKNQLSDNVHNAIRIHHALATKATDYTKKQHVFRLQTADQCEYLFQTSDSKELQSWIDTINFVCASFSAPPLEGGVGSQKRFQRPLLPCSQTKLLLRDQLTSHEEHVTKLENSLSEHRRGSVPTKGLALQNYKEKENYLQFELKRYKTYVYLLSSHINSNPNDNIINLIIGSNNSASSTPTLGEEDELKPLASVSLNNQQQQQQQNQGTNRKESKHKLKS